MHRRSSIALAVAAALSLCAAAPLHAQTGKVALQQAAQALGPALDALAAKTGVRLLYSLEAVKGKQAPALAGSLSAEEALARLLAGSGLTWTKSADGAYAIKPAPAGEKPTELSTIEVKGAADTGYSAKRASVGTKMDAELFDTPVFVNVVPSMAIEERKTVNLQDTLQFVAGIATTNPGTSDNYFAIRGFATSGVILRDGMQSTTDKGFRTMYDMYNVERVEVLKGPASVLNGRSSPGGAINLVTKQPQADPAYSVEQRLGSFNLQRTAADATGPLNEDKSLLYRINFVYDDSDTYRDFGIQQRTGIDGSLTWHPSAATEVKIDAQYLKVKYHFDNGIVVKGDQIIDVPVDRSISDPRKPDDWVEESHLGFDLSHKFNANWSIRDRFGFTYREGFDQSLGVYSANPFRADGVTIDRNMSTQWSDTKVVANSLELLGDFNALGARHQTLVGLDYLYDFTRYTQASLFSTLAASQAAGLGLNIFNPTYGGFSSALFDQNSDFTLNGTKSRSVFENKNVGVYVQDLLTYGGNLHILLGGRWDVAKTGRGNGNSTGQDYGPATGDLNANGIRRDTAFSPRLGVLYQPLTWLGVFTSYTTAFQTNQAISATQLFPPQKSKQFEAGLKAELLDGNLSTSMTVFDLTKTNILYVDPATPTAPFNYLLRGEQRSRGLEWALNGNITSRLSVLGNITYIQKAWVSEDKTVAQGGQLGLPLPGVNRKQGSLWLSYNLPVETSGTWTVGGGSFFAYDRQSDATSTFDLPGYTRWDGFAAYKFKTGAGKWTAQLNIQNIFDKKYYITASSRTAVFPGAPRTAIASLRLDF